MRRRIGREPDRQAGECFVVSLPDLFAPDKVGFEPVELVDPERGLDIGHVVLEPGLDDFVVLVTCVGVARPGVFQIDALDEGLQKAEIATGEFQVIGAVGLP